MKKIIFSLISATLLLSVHAGILDSDVKLGAIPDRDGKVSFSIYAPGKDKISVVGDFNDWDREANPMTEDSDGIWSTTVQLDDGEYRYKFAIDDKETFLGDPYAHDVDWNSYGPNAVVEVGGRPYSWGDSFYDAPPLNDLIIYETHVGDFSAHGSYDGMKDKIPYLKKLGINAIQLMPIMEFPGDISWGYNPAYFFAPETAYGTPEEFKELVDECHQQGIAVILDVVFNHCCGDCPLAQLYPYNENPYFSTDSNPWGFPDFNHWNDSTKRFIKDVLEHWIREYHIDGFRFDYTIGIGYDGYNGVSYMAWAARNIKNDVYLIAEHLPQDPHVVHSTNIDSLWHDTFHDQMKANLREGVYEHSNHWGDLDKTVKGLFFAADGFSDNAQVINYTESHDEERVIFEAQTNPYLNYDIAVQKSRLGAITLFTAAGVPMIYHGQEWGEDTKKTIDPNRLNWSKMNSSTGKSLYWLYSALIKLRKDHMCLRFNNMEVMGQWNDKKTLAFKRWGSGGDVIVVVLNFSNDTQYVDVPFPYNGDWHERIYDFKVNVQGNSLNGHDIPGSSGKIFCMRKTW